MNTTRDWRLAAVVVIGSCILAAADVRGQSDRSARDGFSASEPVPDTEKDEHLWDVPPDTPASTDSGATINPVLLSHVRDNTLGLEYGDRPAYFYTLWLCTQLSPETIHQFSLAYRDQRQAANPKYAKRPRTEFPQFADVFQHPAEYRGRPVTLHGYFRKLVKYAAGKNDLSIDDVYEGWLYTDDSQGNPAVVIFTKKPDGLPVGGDITEEVRFSGYFLKMYGYDAQDTTRKAPMFLAGEVQWYPNKGIERSQMPPWVYVALSAVAILLVWGVWQLNQQRAPTLSRFNSPGRNFDDFPPQEFLPDGDGRPVEPHH